MARKVIVAEYEGVGGPTTSGIAGDGFKAGPTDAGSYVLAYCGRHSSRRYPVWSRIRWGTPMKDDKGKILVKVNSRWRRLSVYTTATRNDILDYHEQLYGTRKIPKKWVFNDFGSMTCYMFKDRNKNRKLDGKEKIHGEFFHTTPRTEALTARGRSVSLVESHGCVHVKPDAIKEMRAKGYMRSGNPIIVHRYGRLPPSAPKGKGGPPYEVHFFPGAKKILIKGMQR